MRTYLISMAVVKDYSIIDENVEDKVLKTSIYEAQEQYLEPILGTTLYNKLLADTEAKVLHSDYQDLIVNHVWDFLIPAVQYKLTLNLIYRYTNKSIVKDNNEISTSISLQELNVRRQELEQSMKYHQQKLILHLQNNTAKYPEYEEVSDEGLGASTITQPINFYADDDANMYNPSISMAQISQSLKNE